MTSWEVTQSSLSGEGQHQDGIHAAKRVTTGVSHANVEVSIAGSESQPCKGPEAGMSLPCLEIEGGPWLLEPRGQRKFCKAWGQAGLQRKGGRILKPCPATLQMSHLEQAPSPSSFTWPTYPSPWASKLPRAPCILGRHFGLWTRMSFEAQTHFCMSYSAGTTAYKLFPTLRGDPAPGPVAGSWQPRAGFPISRHRYSKRSCTR